MSFTIINSNTNTTSIHLQSDSIGDEIDESSYLISTFFNLFWYIIGLVVFCICCISCLLLFYLQQNRKYDNKIKNQVSVSHDNTHSHPKSSKPSTNTPPSTYTRSLHKSPAKHSHNSSISTSASTTMPLSYKTNNKNQSIMSSKYGNIINSSVYSLSAFSGVDSQGIDIDDQTFDNIKTSSIFKHLGSIRDRDKYELSHSSSNSSSSIGSSSNSIGNSNSTSKSNNNEPQPKEYNMYGRKLRNTNDMIIHETDSENSSESSIDSSVDSNQNTIIAMMKKRSVQSPNNKYNMKYEKTNEKSVNDLDKNDIIIV